MHNVDPASALFAQSNQQFDGTEFRFVWPRVQIGPIHTPVRLYQFLCSGIDWSRQLCVDEQWQTRFLEIWKSGTQMGFFYHREFVDPGVNQKAFKAGHPSGSEGSNSFEIFGD